ncbi:sodium-coupled monocarboxylate transporter 1-like [Clavelina lepadiformis]|uniref:Sodium-coupled monocarboxylate transporter 1 n=1 Tax=Clavelina lepadiformis TaxID=159417 RepID=A0ABP0GGT8_CLALP
MSSETTFPINPTSSGAAIAADLPAKNTFQVADYVVFVFMLLISAAIGIYFAFEQRRSKSETTDSYLMANRQMSYGPVSMSLIASFMSSVTILGVPAEYYIYGSMFTWFGLLYLLIPFIIGWIYLPVFYDLGISSTYEYLERRFNRATRLICTFMFLVLSVLYGGIVVYGPALALSEATGFDMWIAILSTGLVCIFYTSLGGLKAVIWTDVFQAILMITGFIAVIIQGSINFNGFSNIWKAAEEGGRIDFVHFEFDPRIRHTFWAMMVGGVIFWISINGVNQTQVQRYLCCKTKRDAKIAIILNGIGLVVILVLAGMTGLTIFATYRHCDPIDSGKIRKSDQLFPFIVMDILGYLPGIPGLFVAGVYSSSLSTISSGMNAMACVALEDFIKPFTKWKTKTYTLLSKLLSLGFGVSFILLAYLASHVGGLIRMAYSVHGIIGGPVVGLFTIGIMLPFVNGWGALVGVCLGWGSSIWMFVGSTFYPKSEEFFNVLPRSTKGCSASDVISSVSDEARALEVTLAERVFNTTLISSTSSSVTTERPPIADFYAASYLYLAVVGCLTTIVFAILFSLLTGFTKRNPPPKELLWSLYHSTRDEDKAPLERSSSWFSPTALANAQAVRNLSNSSLKFEGTEQESLTKSNLKQGASSFDDVLYGEERESSI